MNASDMTASIDVCRCAASINRTKIRVTPVNISTIPFCLLCPSRFRLRRSCCLWDNRIYRLNMRSDTSVLSTLSFSSLNWTLLLATKFQVVQQNVGPDTSVHFTLLFFALAANGASSYGTAVRNTLIPSRF